MAATLELAWGEENARPTRNVSIDEAEHLCATVVPEDRPKSFSISLELQRRLTMCHER